MKEMPVEKEVFQWHPAFYAGIQIELKEDKENLIFENEHQLSTKPMEVDVLVIKYVQTTDKIVSKFALSTEEASDYMQKYW